MSVNKTALELEITMCDCVDITKPWSTRADRAAERKQNGDYSGNHGEGMQMTKADCKTYAQVRSSCQLVWLSLSAGCHRMCP